MSTMRKIIIPLLLFIYLIGSGIIPPVPKRQTSSIFLHHPSSDSLFSSVNTGEIAKFRIHAP